MKFCINEQITNYAESHNSDEAEALLEAINQAEENSTAMDSDDIVQAAVKFLDKLVEEGQLMETEKRPLLELVEYKEDKEGEDESDILSASVDGDVSY